jgi:hypothetical protein
MTHTTISNRHHRIVAYIEVGVRGIHRVTDQHHRTLGYYDPRTNRTTEGHRRIVAYGYALPRLLQGDLHEDGEAGIVKPEPPLAPLKARAESDHLEKVQKCDRDAQASCGTKVQDLRSQLSGLNSIRRWRWRADDVQIPALNGLGRRWRTCSGYRTSSRRCWSRSCRRASPARDANHLRQSLKEVHTTPVAPSTRSRKRSIRHDERRYRER